MTVSGEKKACMDVLKILDQAFDNQWLLVCTDLEDQYVPLIISRTAMLLTFP